LATFLKYFSIGATNLKTVRLSKHQHSIRGNNFSADAVISFLDNGSKLEAIILQDETFCQIDEKIRNVWEKLPNLKFFHSGNSKISKHCARTCIGNSELLILSIGGDFYFKSSLVIDQVKQLISEQARIHGLTFNKTYNIFTF